MTTNQISGLARRAEALAERVPPPARWAADLATSAVAWTGAIIALTAAVGNPSLFLLLGAWVFAAVALRRNLKAVLREETVGRAVRYLAERVRGIGVEDALRDVVGEEALKEAGGAEKLFPGSSRRRVRLAAVVVAGPFLVFLLAVLPSAVWLLCLPVAAANMALAALLVASKRRARMTMPDARIDEEE